MPKQLFIVLLFAVAIATLLLFSGVLIYYGIRRSKSKKQVQGMDAKKKLQMLNELLEPFGFYYDKQVDIISSLKDAWQRNTGYNAFYDKAASKFNMVIEEVPIYFDYQDKTWLIEFWKGQYGITTGCEVGVYCSDETIKPEMRKLSHYNAIDDEQMPYIQFRLSKKGMEFVHDNLHWWLTAFRVGEFSKPEELDYRVKITFRTKELAQAFYNGLNESGYQEEKAEIRGQTVYLWMPATQDAEKGRFFDRWQRRIAQWMNKLWVTFYRYITNPFKDTEDRILFLYFQMPIMLKGFLRIL